MVQQQGWLAGCLQPSTTWQFSNHMISVRFWLKSYLTWDNLYYRSPGNGCSLAQRQTSAHNISWISSSWTRSILVTQPKARGKEMKPSSTFDSNHVAYQQRETVNMQGDGSLASVPQPLVYEHGACCQEWMSLIELQRLKEQSHRIWTDWEVTFKNRRFDRKCSNSFFKSNRCQVLIEVYEKLVIKFK